MPSVHGRWCSKTLALKGEVVARTATSHGDAWLVRTTTGTLLRVVPVFDFEASDSFLAALSSDEPDET